MPYDAFLLIDGKSTKGVEIKGESTDHDAKFKDKACEIYSFSFGVSNPVTLGSGGAGAGAGKCSISSLNFMKKLDASSPYLFRSCADGGHFEKATLTLRKAGGAELEYLIFELKTVFVESCQWSGSSGGDDTPTESVSLAFGKINVKYQPQDDKGAKKGAAKEQSWNIQTNAPD